VNTRDATEKPSEAVQNSPNYYTLKLNNDLFWGVKRPYLDDFLAYCAQRYDQIGIWSAGKPAYVDAVVQVLNLPFKPAFVLNYDQCDRVHDYSSQGLAEFPEISKPLSLIFERYPEFTRKNTLIIDDREDYAKRNLLNWLAIPPFDPPLEEIMKEEDDYLLRLMVWMQEESVASNPDVVALEKSWF